MAGLKMATVRVGLLAGWIALSSPAPAAPSDAHWLGTWATSQQVPEPNNALPTGALDDATLRQVVHLSAGGRRLRVRLSNAFGTEPLEITAVHVARAVRPGSAAIEAGSDHIVLFGGKGLVTIPAGADYLSDPVDMTTPALASLTVSIHFVRGPAHQTGHPGSRATSYLARGDQVAAADLTGPTTVDHWYQLSGVDVEAATAGRAIVALGDSITDGHGATTNGNDRWTDVLATRLQARGMRSVSVLNQGIGGNHLLTDGLGPNALARFDRDVLAQAGVRYLLVLEGVNDLGGLARDETATDERRTALVQRITDAYAQIIARAHAHGVKAIGGTILPYAGSDYYHPGPADEAARQAINAWIRAPGHFDAVVDFDRLTRDPAHPDRMQAAFDSGDHLHPSPAGYRAMAGAVPLELFDS